MNGEANNERVTVHTQSRNRARQCNWGWVFFGFGLLVVRPSVIVRIMYSSQVYTIRVLKTSFLCVCAFVCMW